MHQLSRVAVRRPVTTAMVFLALVILGLVAVKRLPVQLLPDVTVPTIGVFLSQPGASGSETLDELTRPVESIAAELPRVERIRSWTGSWGTWLQVDFEYGTDIRFMTIDLQERLNSFQQDLDDRRTQIVVYPFTTETFNNYLMEIALEGENDPAYLRDLVRDQIEPQLKSITGVAKVEISGLVSDAAEVILDPARLSSYGLDFGRVFARLQTAASDDTFLGEFDVPGETHFVRLDNPVRNIDELRRISVDEAGIISLEDVAEVIEGGTLDNGIYRSNGRNAVGIQIEREESENLIRTARLVRERIDEINAELPPETQLAIQTDVAEIVEDVIEEVRNLAIGGAFLALLVPLLFFRSWRIASIIFVSVPICIVAVFNLFYAVGMSINVFSIVGLALGVGMLVDNSIVVVENCFRLFFSRRLDAVRAAELGGGEVSRALFASTLTTCVPFISLFFLEGEFRLFIKEPALALAFPLLLSLVVALTLSAALTSKALSSVVRHGGARGDEERARASRRLNPPAGRARETYRWLLKGALRHRGRVLLIVALAVMVVWLEACDNVTQTTTNRANQQDIFRVFLVMPPGTETPETLQASLPVEDRLLEHPDVKTFGAWIQGDRASFFLTLLPSRERPTGRTMDEIRAEILDFLPSVPAGELTLRNPDQPAGAEQDAPANVDRVVVRGLDFEVLEPYAARLIEVLRVNPDIARVEIVRDDDQPGYEALIRRERTALYGINAQTLGEYIGATRSGGAISGLILRDGTDRTDVTISVQGTEAETIDAVRELPVYTPTGTTVPLGDLTSFRTARAPSQVRRDNRTSSLAIEYERVPGADGGEVRETVEDILRVLSNPAGVEAEFEGEQRRLEERNKDFVFILLMGTLLIYVVMAAVFESYWVPFTIIATNPLLLIGIVTALAITGLPFGELAAFGVILLIGLAVNNGIVLMDAAMRYRRELGWRPVRAIFQAADHRFRPILMTFMTTFLGLLPLALVGDESSQWKPVAVTVIGGLTSATFLTLLVLPCFYMIGDDFVTRTKPAWMRFLARAFGLTESAGNTLARGAVAVLNVRGWRPLRCPRALWRGMTRTLRILRRTITGAVVILYRSARGLFRFGRDLIGDLIFTLRLVARRAPSQEAGETSAFEAAAGNGHSGVVVETSNLRVIFPRRRLRISLPRKGRPVGHRPVEGLAALDGVTLRIGPGLYGLLGPNGAGKTTLMRCLAGLQQPTRGTVRLFGKNLKDHAEELAPLIGYLPQTHGHYEWMTLREYLGFFAAQTAQTSRRTGGEAGAHLRDASAREAAIRAAAAEVNLEVHLDQRIATFSGGMKQRAGIARVLLQAPPLIIVDEPTAGLDPMERVRVRLLLARLARTRCVIFSTHIVEDLEEGCTAIGILDGGRLLVSEEPEELRRRRAGQVWKVPAGDDAAAARETALAAGARVLYRFADQRGGGWRCLCHRRPHPLAQEAKPTLEDALLAELRPRESDRRAAEAGSALASTGAHSDASRKTP